MRDFDGNEMTIRATNHGKFQVLPANYTPADMTRAPVFATREEAATFTNGPMPQWLAAERAKATASQSYVQTYSDILARPDMREMRRTIQEHYGNYRERGRLAAAAQRAAVRGFGQVSCLGRDIGAVRQGVADEYGDEADQEYRLYVQAEVAYERAVQAAMRQAGIPDGMFRNPVVI